MKNATKLYFEACDRLDAIRKCGNERRVKMHIYAVSIRREDAQRELAAREVSADQALASLFKSFAPQSAKA
jgi:hypothetical protein